jgi:hypothetical protein
VFVPRDLDALDLGLADPHDLLRVVAGAGARVRAAQAAALAVGLGAATERPRSLLVCGRDAALSAAALRAIAGPTCPVPVLSHDGPGLPGFVGPLDLVAVCSSEAADLSAATSADEAGRRGARLLAIGAPDSALLEAAARARGDRLELARGPLDWWANLIPIAIAAAAGRILDLATEEVAATADRLDAVAVTCRPDADVFTNPAKALGSALSEGVPVLWGTSETTAAAACAGEVALLAIAGLAGTAGRLPEQGAPALGLLMPGSDGSTGDELEDLFRDRADEPDDERPGPVVVILRDTTEDAAAAVRAEVVSRVAGERHHPVHVLAAAGDSRLERLASLAGLLSLVAVYAALAAGREPGNQSVSDEIGARLRR